MFHIFSPNNNYLKGVDADGGNDEKVDGADDELAAAMREAQDMQRKRTHTLLKDKDKEANAAGAEGEAEAAVKRHLAEVWRERGPRR